MWFKEYSLSKGCWALWVFMSERDMQALVGRTLKQCKLMVRTAYSALHWVLYGKEPLHPAVRKILFLTVGMISGT